MLHHALRFLLPLILVVTSPLQADERRIRLDPVTGTPTAATAAEIAVPDTQARRIIRMQPVAPARQLPDGSWIAPWPVQAEIRATKRPDGTLRMEEVPR